MHKIYIIALTLILLVGLAACGDTQPSPTLAPETLPPATEATTKEPDPTDAPSATEPLQTEPVEGYGFNLAGMQLIPGATFDADAMPEPNGKFAVPSHSGQGSNDLYYYDAIELTVTNIDGQSFIYSISLIDAQTATDEGLYLGDDLAKVESIYGTDYTQEGSARIYERGNTQLRILIDNDAVFNIEYRML